MTAKKPNARRGNNKSFLQPKKAQSSYLEKVVYMKGSGPFPNLLKRNISGSEANFRDFAGNQDLPNTDILVYMDSSSC